MKKLALASVTFLTATVAAQGWQTLAVGTAPLPRNNHASAFDIISQELVIFGSETASNDTWTFDGTTWTQVISPTSPTGQYSSQMALDLIGPGVTLFGGATSVAAGTALGETWRLSGGVWTLLAPATSPSARIAHAMVSNLTGVGVLLFGGRDNTGTQLNDTWWWDGVNWTLMANGGPPARCCHDLAYDSSRDRTVLFGGWAGTNLGDTWEWDGAVWTQMTPTQSPAARWGHRMAYDLSLQRVVLQGGVLGSTETWLWDGAEWSLLTSIGASVRNHGIHYDSGQNRLLSFGGYPLNADTRAFTVQTPPLLAEFGAGCAGPGGQPQLAAAGTALPWLGSAPTLVATDVPLVGLFVLGYSNTTSAVGPLPASLAAIGMPGCQLLVSNDVILGGVAAGATSQLSLLIPSQASLVGLSVYAQAVSLDLLANSLGFTVSNGLQLTIGEL